LSQHYQKMYVNAHFCLHHITITRQNKTKKIYRQQFLLLLLVAPTIVKTGKRRPPNLTSPQGYQTKRNKKKSVVRSPSQHLFEKKIKPVFALVLSCHRSQGSGSTLGLVQGH